MVICSYIGNKNDCLMRNITDIFIIFGYSKIWHLKYILKSHDEIHKLERILHT